MLSGVLLLSSLAALAVARPQGALVARTFTITFTTTTSMSMPTFIPLAPINSSASTLPFHLLADAKDPRVAGLQFMAADGDFWLGRMDAANNTALQISDGNAFMYTAAPGGQRVFVAKDGALSFTAAHTGGAIPEGGVEQTFGIKSSILRDQFTFAERRDTPNMTDPNAVIDDSALFISPWLACPISQQANSTGTGLEVPSTVGGVNIGPFKIYASKISMTGPGDPPNPGCFPIIAGMEFVGTPDKPPSEPTEYYY